MPYSFKRILLIITSFSALAVNAQETVDNERWYRVEVVIFAANQRWGETEERWPDQLSLNYPKSSVLLAPPPLPSTATATPPATGTPVTTQSGQTQELTPLTNFQQLPKSEFRLSAAAQRISGQKDFRLLKHIAWQQHITAKDQSESIVISGGDAFDQHFELEGTLKLSVERYLHVETDLWLSSFVQSRGLPSQLWESLPPRPIATSKSLSAKGYDPFQLDNNTAEAFGQYGLVTHQYGVEKTVVMRQKRRMRSGELHYIDHPLMGMLIRIEPMELDEPGAVREPSNLR